MRTIAIVLGDNDFGNIFKPLLESICNIVNSRAPGRFLEADVVKLINHGIEFFYRIQIFGRGSNESEESIQKTIKYLRDGITVLFDEEAEKSIETKDYDSGAWYIVLLEGKTYFY